MATGKRKTSLTGSKSHVFFPQPPVNHIACFILLFLPPPSIVDQISELLVFVLLQPDVLEEAKVKGKPLAWQAEPDLAPCRPCTYCVVFGHVT